MLIVKMWGILLFLSTCAGAAPPQIGGLAVLEKESHGGFQEAQMITMNSRAYLSHYGVVEQNYCNLDTLAHVYLYKDAGRLSAGFTGVGPEGSIEYIYIAHEANFIYMPDAYFDSLVAAIDGVSKSTRYQKMVMFPESTVASLPMLYIQFSNTNMQFTIHPKAYTRCETTGAAADKKCVLLVRKNQTGLWVLGKPFTSRIVTSVPIGSDARGVMKVCIARRPVDDLVTAQVVQISRRLPYTTRDYLLYVALGVVVLIIIVWLWSDKICPCFKRRRPQANAVRPPSTTTTAIPVVQGNPIEKTSSEDQQPLLIKV